MKSTMDPESFHSTSSIVVMIVTAIFATIFVLLATMSTCAIALHIFGLGGDNQWVSQHGGLLTAGLVFGSGALYMALHIRFISLSEEITRWIILCLFIAGVVAMTLAMSDPLTDSWAFRAFASSFVVDVL